MDYTTKKSIAICIPCFNESKNIDELYSRVCNSIKNLNYEFQIIFEDNNSTDNTVIKIENLINKDKRVCLIENQLNYGFVRSSSNVLLTAEADANIFLMADLQDPPELIPKLIEEWNKKEYSVIFCSRSSSKENKILFFCKKLYYFTLEKLSDFKVVKDSTGYGIYDKEVINCLRKIIDSYPFIKGLVCASGFKWGTINYKSAKRKRGKSSASLPFLIDFGILGLVTLSKKPLRYITFSGIFFGLIGLIFSLIVLITKILFWTTFQFGIAMLSSVSIFLLGTIVFSIGIIGEYISFIHRRSLGLPLVIEKRKINFKSSKKKVFKKTFSINLDER